MQSESCALSEYAPYEWNDVAIAAGHADAIAAKVRAIAPGAVSLVWCGGAGGFGADDAQMERETAAFLRVLALGLRVAEETGAPFDMHLMSSAGGLFEGVTHCGPDQPVAPLRPYGHGKLAQERALEAALPPERRHVYRPSSVYGFTPGGRLGLISALVANALSGRVTRIGGMPSTIRDYVLAEDIGRYIARRVRGGIASDGRPMILASGRPSAIFEVIRLVEQVSGSALHLQYDPRPENALNMSFRASALPPGWQVTPLELGVRLLVDKMRRRLVLRA